MGPFSLPVNQYTEMVGCGATIRAAVHFKELVIITVCPRPKLEHALGSKRKVQAHGCLDPAAGGCLLMPEAAAVIAPIRAAVALIIAGPVLSESLPCLQRRCFLEKPQQTRHKHAARCLAPPERAATRCSKIVQSWRVLRATVSVFRYRLDPAIRNKECLAVSLICVSANTHLKQRIA